MSQHDPNAFLMGGGSKSAFGKNDPIGHTISGTISDPPEVRQQTDLQTGELKFWPNGDAMMQLVVTIQTNLREDSEDDGKRRIYVKGKSLTDAVREAVRKTGAPGLEVGGTLTVQFTGTEPSQTRGFNDRKLYAASYVRPDTTAASGAFLGVGQTQPAAPQPAANLQQGMQTQPAAPPQWTQPPAAPSPTPVATQVPVAQPAPVQTPAATPPPPAPAPAAAPQYTPEQLAALQAAGIDPATLQQQ